jgi:hypothetical protein
VFDLELKIFRLHQLGIPQDRIAKRLGVPQQTISRYLPKMLEFTKWVNIDLSKGFTVQQVAQKHGWPESLVWSQALVNADSFDRFKALQWGIRTWDVWNFIECDPRFGDEWPGRIPAQLVAHILYFFSEPGDLVLDPMAGGGVVSMDILTLNIIAGALPAKVRGLVEESAELHQNELLTMWNTKEFHPIKPLI